MIWRDLVLVALLLNSMTRHCDAAEAPVVLGYFLTGQDHGAETIHSTLYTHIAIAFAGVGKDNLPQFPDDPAVPEIIARAHAASAKVLLSLGGSDSGAQLNRLAQDSKGRARFIAALVAGLVQQGYDGCDVDWEFPGKKDVAGMLDFLHALAAQLRAKHPAALVTMALPATSWFGQYFPLRPIEADLNFVQIMTYDLHGPWREEGHFSHCGHNSPLNETSSDPIDGKEMSYARFVGYWEEQGIPRAKLIVGIPCYGHGFAVAKLGDTPARKSRYPEIIYSEVEKLARQPGWEKTFDKEAGVPYIRNSSQGELISYDEPASATAKGAWARTAGLRGVFFWEISQDLIDGQNALVEAARRGFLRPAD